MSTLAKASSRTTTGEFTNKALPSAVWVDPQEGSFVNINTINVVKGSPNKELGEKYINFVLSEKIQKDIALAKVDSPVNVNVILNQKQAEGLTYGGELIGSFQDVNWGEINKRKKNWISQWNEIFAN